MQKLCASLNIGTDDGKSGQEVLAKVLARLRALDMVERPN